MPEAPSSPVFRLLRPKPPLAPIQAKRKRKSPSSSPHPTRLSPADPWISLLSGPGCRPEATNSTAPADGPIRAIRAPFASSPSSKPPQRAAPLLVELSSPSDPSRPSFPSISRCPPSEMLMRPEVVVPGAEALHFEVEIRQLVMASSAAPEGRESRAGDRE